MLAAGAVPTVKANPANPTSPIEYPIGTPMNKSVNRTPNPIRALVICYKPARSARGEKASARLKTAANALIAARTYARVPKGRYRKVE